MRNEAEQLLLPLNLGNLGICKILYRWVIALVFYVLSWFLSGCASHQVMTAIEHLIGSLGTLFERKQPVIDRQNPLYSKMPSSTLLLKST